MRRKRKVYGVGLLALFFLISGGAAIGRERPERESNKIAGDLYQFRDKFHNTIFFVTPAGIVATDPINAEAARWLKAELVKRFN